MFVFFFFACMFGSSEEVSEPIPPAEPAPEVAEEPTPEPSAPEPVMIVVDDELTALTNEPTSMAVAEAMALYNSASTSSQLEVAYNKAVVAADALTAWAETSDVGDVDPLLAKTPGLQMGWFAEGTVAVFSLDPEAWKAKAAGTPTGDDDAFFSLTEYTYNQANPGGWAVWEMRNWDYGGCSGLGKGVILEALTMAQAVGAGGSAFSTPTEQVRTAAIQEITRTDPSTFQRCDVDTMAPMPNERLRGEAQQVLNTLTLTGAEREAISAAIPKLEGELFQGG